jgi:uncharacterized protein (TIGR00296 family)
MVNSFLFSPLFVTWRKKKKTMFSQDYTLRGCIGTFTSLPLLEGLQQFAIKSAFNDSRFDPIKREEVEHLQCSVSALLDFEHASDLLDWEIGTHGIQISFEDPISKCMRKATYLPEVCPSQSWTQTQCLESLYRKSGFNGPITQYLKSSTSLIRYSSTKVSLTYPVYQSMR